MNVPQKEKKKEALERMRILGIYPETVKQFKDDDLISISEPPFGACYWIDEKLLQVVRDFEKEFNALVYHGIKSFICDDVMYCFLYVSDEREEWPLDRGDLTADVKIIDPYAYVYNESAPYDSEIGRIGIKRIYSLDAGNHRSKTCLLLRAY